MTSLEPLDGDLSSEAHELALALRRLFGALEVGVRRYAARRSRDAGSVSRYLNGTRIPNWEFVADLLADVAEARGVVLPETVDLLRGLHLAALAASGSPQHRVQLLEQQLAAADLAARRSVVRERALEDALLDAQRRVGDLELQMRQLAVGPDRPPPAQAAQPTLDDLAAARQERDDLRTQIADLRAELKHAHARRVQAELRCAELERELDQADRQAPADLSVDAAQPSSVSETPAVLAAPASEQLAERQASARLNKMYAFDNFAVNSGNRFAHDVAVGVAEAPGSTYNPLYLFGGNGRGKSHLLHAIGNYTRTLYPASEVRYMSLRDVLSIQPGWHTGSAPLDSLPTEHADVLLLDDIDWLSGRTGRAQQASMADTLRRYVDAGKLLVCAAPLPPDHVDWHADLAALFQAGVCLGMEEAPGHSQLLTVLQKKADADGISAPDEALELLASGAGGSVRELEGALTRVAAYASLNHCAIDTGVAQQVLTGLQKSTHQEITGETVLQTVADHFGTTVEILRGKERGRRLVTARHIAMYLCRELTDHPVPTIAALLGSKDLAAVLHAHRKTRALMRQRPSQYTQVSHITSEILFHPRPDQHSPGGASRRPEVPHSTADTPVLGDLPA
ncbi:DnaA/Hda family protein [Streptomyces antibioticus]|uniref:DnaA ATPase domain-containing protein n=1 Tax=Streptomyces antibioticus TaxID=1890 RepID=UPI0033ABE759